MHLQTYYQVSRIDAQAREQNLTVIERDQLRQQKARPILESIKSQIETAKGQTLPKSALAKACNYTLTFWNRLTRFLDHSILELSTNAAENAIRPVALGRKSWIHFGSQEAGPRIAAILSIVETCRRLQIPIRDYLTAICRTPRHLCLGSITCPRNRSAVWECGGRQPTEHGLALPFSAAVFRIALFRAHRE